MRTPTPIPESFAVGYVNIATLEPNGIKGVLAELPFGGNQDGRENTEDKPQ